MRVSVAVVLLVLVFFKAIAALDFMVSLLLTLHQHSSWCGDCSQRDHRIVQPIEYTVVRKTIIWW